MTSIYTDLIFPEDEEEEEEIDIPLPTGAAVAVRRGGRRGYDEARYQAHRAQIRREQEETYQAHRAQLLKEQEEQYQARRAQLLAERAAQEAREAQVRQPKPIAASSPPSRRLALPSWDTVSALLAPDDLRSLVSAWRGGSLGTTAVNQTRLSRYMAYFPFASSPYGFVSGLRAVWASSVPRARRVPAPRPSSIGARASLPRPVRYGRNAVAGATPQPLPALTPPPEGAPIA